VRCVKDPLVFAETLDSRDFKRSGNFEVGRPFLPVLD